MSDCDWTALLTGALPCSNAKGLSVQGCKLCLCACLCHPSPAPPSLYESLVVNEYINDLEGPSLLPEDPAQRAHARLLIDQVILTRCRVTVLKGSPFSCHVVVFTCCQARARLQPRPVLVL